MIDRFVIAAAVDRLIYGDDTTFSADDAKVLLDALPRKRTPWLQLGIAGKMFLHQSGPMEADVGRQAHAPVC
jgi:hypothetical protein